MKIDDDEFHIMLALVISIVLLMAFWAFWATITAQ